MSDVEFITGANHQRAREREWKARRAERDGLREKRERVRRTALSVCWLAGAFLSGMALVLLAEPLLRRRLRSDTPDRDELRRASDYLYRRGFGRDEIRAAIARYQDNFEEY